jgi:hypothetical protein
MPEIGVIRRIEVTADGSTAIHEPKAGRALRCGQSLEPSKSWAGFNLPDGPSSAVWTAAVTPADPI